MAKNTSLNNAAITKKDEFYTQLSDIEAEMRHYKEHFRGKVVFCNCDDPYESNFFKYFAMNFKFLGLKKLIATSYSGSPVATKQLSLLDVKDLDVKSDDARHPYKIEINLSCYQRKLRLVARTNRPTFSSNPLAVTE